MGNKTRKYPGEYVKEKIAEITGFEKDKIELILSKRENDNIPELNYHQFKYKKQIYILNKDILKKME